MGWTFTEFYEQPAFEVLMLQELLQVENALKAEQARKSRRKGKRR